MGAISINEISVIFSKILEKLEFEVEQEIEIDDDFYQFIPADEWTNYEEGSILTGSLSDDINNLKILITDKTRPCTFVDFDRLASVLHAISNQLNPP